MERRIKKWGTILTILCILLVVLIVIEKITYEHYLSPRWVTSAIHDDASESRAFTWHSDHPNDRSLLQVVRLDASNGWDGPEVLTFEGETSTVQDREGKAIAVHKAIATDLEPGTTYRYRAGNGAKKGWSETGVVRTAESEVRDFSFLFVTDSQETNALEFDAWGQTVNQAFSLYPDAAFIIHGGDFVEYPADSKAWNALLLAARSVIMQVPLMPVLGNHDAQDGDVAYFNSHFHVPENGANDIGEGTTYYYDYGNARFIILNTEADIDKQADWLRGVLKENTQEWTIVSFHRGVYGGNQYKELHEWVEVFDQYKVDLVIQGHNHEYARSYPLRENKITSKDNQVYERSGTVMSQ